MSSGNKQVWNNLDEIMKRQVGIRRGSFGLSQDVKLIDHFPNMILDLDSIFDATNV